MAKSPDITKRTSPGIAKNWTTRNSATPQPIKIIPAILVFLILNADTSPAMLIAIIKIPISNAPPKTNPKIGIPIKLLIKKYKKSPKRGIISPRITVTRVNFWYVLIFK